MISAIGNDYHSLGDSNSGGLVKVGRIAGDHYSGFRDSAFAISRWSNDRVSRSIRG